MDASISEKDSSYIHSDKTKIKILNPPLFPNADIREYVYTDSVIGSDQLLEELNLIQQRLNEVHPEPYHYLSRHSFEEKVEFLRKNIEPMSREKWYLKLSMLIAELHDGHTTIRYPYTFRQQYFRQGGKVMPFSVRMEDDGSTTILANYTGDPKLDSAVLSAVNGHPIKELTGQMKLMTFGESDKYRNDQITTYFGRMYWFLYGHTDSVQLQFRQADGNMLKKTYACLSEQEYDLAYKKLYPASASQKSYNMALRTEAGKGTAMLRLKHFGEYKGYQDSIRSVFEELERKKVDTLFIDIRGNGGGEYSITEEINHYLLDAPWVLVSKAKIKMSRYFYQAFPPALRIFKFLPKKMIFKLACRIMTRNMKISRIEVTRDKLSKSRTFDLYLKPKIHFSEKHFFKGKVYLFTDRNSYSMSGMFAAIMKDYNRAVIVGEETGGLANPHGSNTEIKLPYSGFSFFISTSRAYRPSGIFDHKGVEPDIKISYTKLNLAGNIEELRKLIQEK